MSYLHFTLKERIKIEIFYEMGYSSRKIAGILRRSHTSVSREIKRNVDSKSKYKAENAHKNYQINKSKCGRKGKFTKELAEIISAKLTATWSPEQIQFYNNKSIGVSFKTIYNWLYQGKLKGITEKHLRQKGKRRKTKETRGKFLLGTPISKRPKEIKKRIFFGHYELDTMVSSRGKSKGCFATFCEMKSRYFIALKLSDKSSESYRNAINHLLNIYPKTAFKSFTSDRGKEFSCYRNVEENYGIKFYFADPYSAWQRGSNENSNGLLREFYPKKTDLSEVNEKELRLNLYLINNRPRKCLGWKSAFEVFFNELVQLI